MASRPYNAFHVRRPFGGRVELLVLEPKDLGVAASAATSQQVMAERLPNPFLC